MVGHSVVDRETRRVRFPQSGPSAGMKLKWTSAGLQNRKMQVRGLSLLPISPRPDICVGTNPRIDRPRPLISSLPDLKWIRDLATVNSTHCTRGLFAVEIGCRIHGSVSWQ